MPVDITYLPDFRAIAVAYRGHVDKLQLEASIARLIAYSEEQQCNHFLTDCSALTGGHSVIDLYFLAKEVAEAKASMAGYLEAIVRPKDPDLGKMTEFWETTTANRGLKVRSFDDRSQALAWLNAA